MSCRVSAISTYARYWITNLKIEIMKYNGYYEQCANHRDIENLADLGERLLAAELEKVNSYEELPDYIKDNFSESQIKRITSTEEELWHYMNMVRGYEEPSDDPCDLSVVVEWPLSQDLPEGLGRLINDEVGVRIYGPAAYILDAYDYDMWDLDRTECKCYALSPANLLNCSELFYDHAIAYKTMISNDANQHDIVEAFRKLGASGEFCIYRWDRAITESDGEGWTKIGSYNF